MESILEREDMISLGDILFHDVPVDLWSLGLVCVKGLQGLGSITRHFFHISPNSVLFDLRGNVRFYDNFEVDPLFARQRLDESVTAQDQIYSLGMTLMYVHQHNLDFTEDGGDQHIDELLAWLTSDDRLEFRDIVATCQKRVTLKQAKAKIAEIYDEMDREAAVLSQTCLDLSDNPSLREKTSTGSHSVRIPDLSGIYLLSKAPREAETNVSTAAESSHEAEPNGTIAAESSLSDVDIPAWTGSQRPENDSESGEDELRMSRETAKPREEFKRPSQIVEFLRRKHGRIVDCDAKLKSALYLAHEKVYKDKNVFLLDSSNFHAFVSKDQPHPLGSGKRKPLGVLSNWRETNRADQVNYYSTLSIQIFSFVEENNYQNCQFPEDGEMCGRFMDYAKSVLGKENIFHGGNLRLLYMSRFYISPEHLFELIVSHLNIFYRENQKYYVELLRGWILEFYPNDFRNDRMAQKVYKLLNSLVPHFRDSLLNTWIAASREEEAASILLDDLLVGRPGSGENDVLMLAGEADVAAILHFLLQLAYNGAKPIFYEEILERLKNTGDPTNIFSIGLRRAHRVELLLSRWVAAELTRVGDKKKQYRLMKKVIAILKLSARARDFAVADVVLSALQSADVRSLKVWDKISPRTINTIEKIERILEGLATNMPADCNITCSVEIFRNYIIGDSRLTCGDFCHRAIFWSLMNRHNYSICEDPTLLEDVVTRIKQLTP